MVFGSAGNFWLIISFSEEEKKKRNLFIAFTCALSVGVRKGVSGRMVLVLGSVDLSALLGRCVIDIAVAMEYLSYGLLNGRLLMRCGSLVGSVDAC